jgi:hypothetical protein
LIADEATRTKVGLLKAIPRKPGGLNQAMKVRKVHWQVPSSWVNREEEDVEAKLISTHKGDLQDVLDAFRGGTLKALRHP